MILDIVTLFGTLGYIYIPTMWFPIWYLGPLAIYILSKEYIRAAVWICIISVILSQTSLTPWWVYIGYYGIWCVGVYVSSRFFDRGWAVQSILATVWLMISVLIVNKFSISLENMVLFGFVNGIWLAIVLKVAHKYNIYEQVNA